MNNLKILYSFTWISSGLNGTCNLGRYQLLEGLLHFPSREEEQRSFLHADTGMAHKAKLKGTFAACHTDGTERGCWGTGEAAQRQVQVWRDGFPCLLPDCSQMQQAF